jgi:hypothetical protein
VLHIKLPKGKVSQACERAAEEATRRIAVANDRYRSELERWRKDGEYGEPPDKPRDFFLLTEDRNKLHAMADMAKHSTGDVYISPELWRAIKGVY